MLNVYWIGTERVFYIGDVLGFPKGFYFNEIMGCFVSFRLIS